MMKITQHMLMTKEVAVHPYFEIHLDLTYMTETEFQNAMVQIGKMVPNLDVVLRKPEV